MSNHFRCALLATVLFTACGLAVIAEDNAPAHSSRFDREIAAFEQWDRKNSFPHDAILFVGSSSIRRWQTAESFPDLPAINRGFGGSTVADINHFADRIVFKYRPRVIVFYAGDNDIASGKSPDRVFADFQMFANSVRERLPDTQIIYLPTKPSIARWKLWPKMQIVNARIKGLTKNNNQLIFVDTATPILGDDGQPRRDFFLDDGLHLSERGYARWTDILAPVLRDR